MAEKTAAVSRPGWCVEGAIVRQLPRTYRWWSAWLRRAPGRRRGGVWAGSAAFRLVRHALGRDSLCTLRTSERGALTIDLRDFDCFHHTLDVWLYGSSQHRLMSRLIRPGDVFADVGANYGVYSLHAALQGAHVLAFEPNPTVANALRTTIAANPGSSVDLRQAAVGAMPGSVTFHVPRGGSGTGSLYRSHAEHDAAATAIRCEMTTIDSLALSRLDAVKIDVECAEADVLKGSRRTLSTLRPPVWFEWNPAALAAAHKSDSEAMDLLRDFGYTQFLDVDTLQPLKSEQPGLFNVLALPAGASLSRLLH